jgi:predicted nucleic acid-binding protein
LRRLLYSPISYIERQTTVVPIEPQVAGEAGKKKWEMREHSPEVGLADAVVLATARELNAKVLTGDPDFLVEAFSDEVIIYLNIRKV